MNKPAPEKCAGSTRPKGYWVGRLTPVQSKIALVQSSHVWSMIYNVRTLNRTKLTILQCMCDQHRLRSVCASTQYIKQASCILYDQRRVWSECAVAVALFIPLWTARPSKVNMISECFYQNVQLRRLTRVFARRTTFLLHQVVIGGIYN